MLTKDAIAYFGTAAALARALDVTPSAISQWGERVPGLRQLQLQLMTRELVAEPYLAPVRTPTLEYEE